MEEAVYLTGTESERSFPLGRFIPQIPEGVVSKWLADRLPRGSNLLDPFGTTPQTSIEAALAGYRIIAVSNNPIVSFILKILVTAPGEGEIQAALSTFASSRKGDERLEVHLQSLYETECPVCGEKIQANRFIWDKHLQQPSSKEVVCPYCHAEGEFPVTPEDLARLDPFKRNPLQRARALERIAGLDDQFRGEAQQAVDCYLPRPLYALFTMINRLDNLEITPRQREILTALLLVCCDQASALWPYPNIRAHPRQLAIPPKFHENNLWKAFERAADELAHAGTVVPFSEWPSPPPEQAGIYLIQGRIRDAAQIFSSSQVQGVLTVFPRPNQAFWTLSAVWAGWLWGQEFVKPLKHVLSRRRYDWNWHTSALASSLTTLNEHLPEGIPIFGLVPEAEPAFISAVVTAAGTAHLEFMGMAVREDDEFAQIHHQSGDKVPHNPDIDPSTVIRPSVLDFLGELGEPATYMQMSNAALAGLARRRALLVDQPLTQLNNALRRVFADHDLFQRYQESSATFELGYWWLRSPVPSTIALADRMETEVCELLLHQPGITRRELDQTLCRRFRGLLTPPSDLLRVLIESYAEQHPSGSGVLYLRPQDEAENRSQDIRHQRAAIITLGKTLGFNIAEDSSLRWKSADNQAVYQFHIQSSAVFTPLVYGIDDSQGMPVLVLPGSRANLVAFKIRRDPALHQLIESRWQIVKFRHIHELSENPMLTLDMWKKQISTDPPEYHAVQLDMF